jgi:hypothetical protein
LECGEGGWAARRKHEGYQQAYDIAPDAVVSLGNLAYDSKKESYGHLCHRIWAVCRNTAHRHVQLQSLFVRRLVCHDSFETTVMQRVGPVRDQNMREMGRETCLSGLFKVDVVETSVPEQNQFDAQLFKLSEDCCVRSVVDK